MAGEQMDLFGVIHYVADALHQWVGGKKTPPQTASLPENVSLHYAPRLRRGWRARFHRMSKRVDITLPSYMQSDEFHAVRELVVEWARIASRRKTVQSREKMRELERKVWAISEQILVDSGQKGLGTQRIPPIRPQGQVHDLEKVLEAVNQTYFKGELRCRITWSGRKGGLSFHTTRTDAITNEIVHVISISKGYDQKNCPEYAVAGVVYHECLHIVIPPVMKNERRVVHGKAFRQREKLYLFYDEWQKWHRMVLPSNVKEL